MQDNTEAPTTRAAHPAQREARSVLEPLPHQLVRDAFDRVLRGWGHHGDGLLASLERERWIYFIQGDDGGPVKIGHTKRLRLRLENLDDAYPFGTLRIVGLLVGRVAIESQLHCQFAHLRLKGEWFAPAQDLVEFVRALPKESWR